jgi:flagellar biogenesis protein FliO
MIKNQIIILLAIVAAAIWVIYRIREGRRNSKDTTDKE